MPDEKIFVIPLREAKKTVRYKRAGRAAKVVREFLKRHMKSDEIKLDVALNNKLWERGIKKPPSKVRVRAVKEEDGSVKASLAE
ncbi:MAG: 50S ribosomal protein L31e [Candidatus Hadarchaeota archaeon]